MIIRKVLKLIWDTFWIEVDFVNWWWRTASLRGKDDVQEIGTVLFCHLNTMISVTKVDALFATALAARGYKPIFLLRNRSRALMRLISSCTYARFLFLEDYLTNELLHTARQQATNLLSSAPDLEALLNLKIDGYRTGRNVQSRVVRSLRVGQLDYENTLHLKALLEALVESLAVGQVAIRLLETLTPNKAIFLEKGYTPAAEIYDACLLNGVDVVQWCSAPQDDHIILKRYSLENRAAHPLSLGDDSWAEICSVPWSLQKDNLVREKIASHYLSGAWYNRQQLQEGKKFIPPELIRSRLGVKSGRKLAVIFAHIMYDATFFYGSSLFSNYERWLVETVRCAIANPNLHWLVKVHPVNVWRSQMDGVVMEQMELQILTREFGELPEHVTIMSADTEINTYSLFSILDFGLTVRGTIGMELPCFGVPVVTAGTGRYSGRGFTIDPRDIADYKKLLSELHMHSSLGAEIVSLACRYAYVTFFLRPYPLSSFKIVDDHSWFRGLSTLKQNLHLDCENAVMAIHDGDLSGIANFVIDESRLELLIEDEFFSNAHSGEFDR